MSTAYAHVHFKRITFLWPELVQVRFSKLDCQRLVPVYASLILAAFNFVVAMKFLMNWPFYFVHKLFFVGRYSVGNLHFFFRTQRTKLPNLIA